jgi:hypothetical protein
MTDLFSQFWIPVAVIVAAAVIIGLGRWILTWVRQQADAAANAPHSANRLGEIATYVRSGFRLKAVLERDHDTNRARAIIGWQKPPLPDDGHTVRLKDMTSRPFQRAESFAWQVYAECVPFCAANGWKPLEIYGWSRSDLIMPMNKVWTILFDEQKVVIAPGWTPIPSFPNKRITSYGSFNLPPQQ